MRSIAAQLSESYDARPDSVGRARRAVAEFAREAGVDEEQVDAIRLAVSEAVTNAVLHAYPDAPGRVHLTAALSGAQLRVRVADEGVGLRSRSGRPGLGLGLDLIARTCDDVSIAPRPSGGTEVRFALTGAAAGGDRPRRAVAVKA